MINLQSEITRRLAKAERWAAIMEQHGQVNTCHHEAARNLRAQLAALKAPEPAKVQAAHKGA